MFSKSFCCRTRCIAGVVLLSSRLFLFCKITDEVLLLFLCSKFSVFMFISCSFFLFLFVILFLFISKNRFGTGLSFVIRNEFVYGELRTIKVC